MRAWSAWSRARRPRSISATRKAIRRSRSARRPAKKSIIRSSASDPARRQHARRAGGAEPRQAHLCRGRGRGAADHRHGAGGDDRLGRIVGAGAARRRTRARHSLHKPARSCPTASRSAMWCCTSRASSSPITSPRTCQGNQAAGRGADQAARRSRPHAGARRRRRRRRAPRCAGSLPHVRQRPGLVAQAA
jgi:hypothetical protein